MRVMNIVLNNVLDDGRVIKTARSGKAILGDSMILGFSRTKKREELEIDNVKVVLIPHPSRALKAQGRWSSDPNTRDMDEFVNIAAELIKPDVLDYLPNVLHTHDMFGLGVGALLTRKLLGTKSCPRWLHDCHEYTQGASNIPVGIHAYAVKQHEQFIKEPDFLTTVSDGIADYLIKDDTLSSRPEVILNVPVAKPEPDQKVSDIKTAIGLDADQKLIVYSGSIASPQRGVATLIEAMRFMPDVHVAVITNRPKAFDELQGLAAEFGTEARLHMHDYVPVDQISRFLRTADLGCHPIRRYPNSEVALPNKLFDYLHAGLPVVVSDVETMSEFVQRHGVGVVFESGNAEDLAQKCNDVLERTRDFQKQMTEEFKTEFSWESQEKKLAEIYRDLLGIEKNKTGSYKVMHGLTSASGQPWATVNALRKLGVKADAVRAFPERTPMKIPAHRVLSTVEGNQNLLAFSRFAPNYDVFHFYARSFFSGNKGFQFPSATDLIALRSAGKKTVFNFRGTDARLPSVFREKSPYHWLPTSATPEEAKAELLQKSYIELVQKLSNAVTVIDNELLTYIPNARIVPRAIDLTNWKTNDTDKSSRPLIVHAPTNRDIKGTEKVIKAIENLRNKGEDFEFKIVENTPNDIAREIYARADIIIDQLRIGWYGVLAVEGMALGKPVMSYIRDDLIHDFETPPIFPTKMETLEADIGFLLNSPVARTEIGQIGRAYVEEVHDSGRVAQLYKDIYEEILSVNDPIDIDSCISLLGQQIEMPKRARKRSSPKQPQAKKPFFERKKIQVKRIAAKALFKSDHKKS